MTNFLHGFLDQVENWFHSGQRFAMARVVESFGSAPLPIGSTMVVGPSGEALGSVSGGCVEGAVYHSATEVLRGSLPRIEEYGYTDSDAIAVGLTCGGTLTVLIEAVDRDAFPQFEHVISRARQSIPVAWATGPLTTAGKEVHRIVLDDSNVPLGTFGDITLDREISGSLEASLTTGTSGTHRTVVRGSDFADATGGSENLDLFFHVMAGPPRLIVVGASTHATALSALGRALGYHTTVCDARPIFTTDDRFPYAHNVVRQWPGRYLATTLIDTRTAICILTHDTRFDVPSIVAALASSAGYIGVMGSRRTHEDRTRRLHDAGVPIDQLSRIRSPIGLDLGGRSADETALSILAEIVAVRNGRSGTALTDTRGSIH